MEFEISFSGIREHIDFINEEKKSLLVLKEKIEICNAIQTALSTDTGNENKKLIESLEIAEKSMNNRINFLEETVIGAKRLMQNNAEIVKGNSKTFDLLF